MDPAGARLLSGGYDYDVKMYDFGGMDASFQAFRTVQPCESHVITSLSYSSNGDGILVTSGKAQAAVLLRDGKTFLETDKGDQYIVDMSNTKGHVAPINCGSWNPKVKDEFITCSDDGTVRLWSTAQRQVQGRRCVSVIKPRNPQGKKTIPTTCTFSRDGVYIVCGCDDGSLQLWEYGRTAYVYPKLQVRAAHAPGNVITSTCMSYCNRLLLSRSLDDTMKLWDLRMFKKPVHEVDSLDTFFPMTDCILSPDQRFAVTGTSAKKGEGAGKLLFYDTTSFDLKYEIEFPNCSVIRLLWHPKLNQIFAGLSDGRIMLYYSPLRSQHGALLCVVKGTKRVKEQPFVTESQIIARKLKLILYILS